MRTDALLSILKDFHREKLTLRQRHVAVAKQVPQYDANNTYQYVINREDVHLQWLEAAIAELGGTPDDVEEPSLPRLVWAETHASLVIQDATDAAAFVARWRPRLPDISHARHCTMMDVILGETLEQKRFFEQALAGRMDLLGRRTEEVGARVGTVLPTRWIE